MNRLIKSICFVALVAMLSFGGATCTADDTEPAWLSPLSQFQDLLSRRQINLFPDFTQNRHSPLLFSPRRLQWYGYPNPDASHVVKVQTKQLLLNCQYVACTTIRSPNWIVNTYLGPVDSSTPLFFIAILHELS